MNHQCNLCDRETEHKHSHTVERRYYENRDHRDDAEAYACTGCGTVRVLDD
jgi:hypothetical protein